jgi:hypothetical protein
MNYFEIYPGGMITGELVIETDKSPDEDGNILMTSEEYDNAFSKIGRESRHQMNYYQGYDVTNHDGRVVLHRLPFDHPSVQELLKEAP